MAVMDSRPLSWGERRELANTLRREAAEKLAEAQRIEDGLQSDMAAITAAIKNKTSPNG